MRARARGKDEAEEGRGQGRRGRESGRAGQRGGEVARDSDKEREEGRGREVGRQGWWWWGGVT